MFWTWDHSTEWVLNRPGAQTMGALNPYTRHPETFVEDYTRLLRWCGRHGVDAVVVWGLLRDSHGGIEAARRLCDVARQQGVRLLCGVGLNAYGGVFYEGDSPYSLERHLERHPELCAVDEAGNKVVHGSGVSGRRREHNACPSLAGNQDFAVESLRWLFQTLPLGGVQVETGDTGVCRCKRCETRRRHPVSRFSWEDMALMYPLAASAIRSVAPDAWIVCETYSHPEPHPEPEKPPNFGDGKPPWADECLREFPRLVFVQWVCDKFVKPKSSMLWTRAGTVSAEGGRRHVMRAHFGTYWGGGYRGELAIDWLAEMVQRSIDHGFDAISIIGEVSPQQAGAELNYLALANYGSTSNPRAELEVFLRDVASPLLGGLGRARDFLRYARLSQDPKQIPAALRAIHALCGRLALEPAQRWVWLANYLGSFLESQPG